MNYVQEDCTESTSFDEQLKKLNEQLLEWQKRFQEAESKVNERESKIKALGVFIGEFDQIISAYKEKQPDLSKKQCLYDKSYKDLKTCLESILGEDCYEQVCKTANLINDEIRNLEEVIHCDEDALTTAKEEKEIARGKLDKAGNLFELLKNPVKSIEARFKLLDQLLKEIELNKNSSPTIAYYLLKCDGKFYSQVEDDPKVYSPEEFIQELTCAWNNYNLAVSNFNEAAVKVKSLETKLEIERAQLVADKKNLETKIQRKLNELANSSACSKRTDTCNETEEK